MLTPSYLLNATEPAEEIAEKLHGDILIRIIERIKIRFERGDDYILTAVDKWQIETLQQAGFLLDDIQKEIASATGYMQTEIAEAMEDAGVKALAYDDAIYREAGLDPVPLVQSPYLIQLMQDTYEQTAGEWKNFTSISKRAVHDLFVETCDTAYMQAISGAISPAQAYLEALEKIVEGGVYVQYPGGRRDTIETATARAVRTGISQASGRIQIARMEEMDVDLVLVSSHLGARPEHYVWQGKVYSRNGGGEYPDFVEATGYGTVTGLCGANCRHNFSPYFEGMKNPFQEYDSEENQKQYELEQRQRTLERRIRDTKRQTMGWKTALDGEEYPVKKAALEEKYQPKAALLQKQNKAYNDFCESTGQKKRSDRIAIAKWNRKQAAQARAAAKKWNNRPNPSGNPVAFTR
ncbi:MAG: phage minor capsid protein, partial [Oscillospiraceae bacterium]|nr:phage minor capsid protein [Oscillospiraceae bacterium]